MSPPPELHRGVGQGLGSGGDDAVPKGDGPGPHVLPLPADLGPLYRGTASGPGFVQALEGEQAVDEVLFEGDEAFGGGGPAGKSGPEMRSAGPYMVPNLLSTSLVEP